MAKNGPNKVLELGIFVDEAATSMFLAYYGKGEYVKLREFILAFVNGVINNQQFFIFKTNAKFRLLLIDASALPSAQSGTAY